MEYQELRLTRPSYKDRFELLEIEKEVDSEWMMFHHEDSGAQEAVRPHPILPCRQDARRHSSTGIMSGKHNV